MSIARTCLIAWLVAGGVAAADEVKPIATATDSERTARIGPVRVEKDGVVIRSAEELVARTARAKDANDPAVQKEFAAAVAKLLKVEAIDWDKQMLIGIIATEVVSVTADGKNLTVTYRPYQEPLTRAVPRTPKHLLLLGRTDGDVKFVAKKD
jgi:hypothetical protein